MQPVLTHDKQAPSALSFVPGACLFDLDGTLVDSEPLFELSEERLLEGFGIIVGEELTHELFGRSAEGFFEIMERRFSESPINRLPLAERLALKNKAYFEVARGRVKTFAATESLARAMAAAGMPLAIASSSNHEIIDFELKATGLDGIFQVRVSAVEVPRGKPEPDVYLEAARRLGVDPRRCVAFEDSALGVRAAKAAGAFTIALPAPGSDLARFAQADHLVEGGPAGLDVAKMLQLLRIYSPGNLISD